MKPAVENCVEKLYIADDNHQAISKYNGRCPYYAYYAAREDYPRKSTIVSIPDTYQLVGASRRILVRITTLYYTGKLLEANFCGVLPVTNTHEHHLFMQDFSR